MIGHYRKVLDSRIAAGKVYLNDKQTLITGYDEKEGCAVVIVEGKEVILTENDNLLINGHESKRPD